MTMALTENLAEIAIDGLRLRCRHGVMPQERVVGNDFEYTIVMRYDASEAVKSDDISAAVNYAEAVDVVRRTMETPSQLLEHAAGRLIDAFFAAFPSVCFVKVCVTKVAPPIPAQMRGVSVTLARSR